MNDVYDGWARDPRVLAALSAYEQWVGQQQPALDAHLNAELRYAVKLTAAHAAGVRSEPHFTLESAVRRVRPERREMILGQLQAIIRLAVPEPVAHEYHPENYDDPYCESCRPWRTQVKVVRPSKHGWWVTLPGWISDEPVLVSGSEIPEEISSHFKPDFRLHARVNIGAEYAGLLKFRGWEL
jgi:hypothetical protein